MNIIGHDQPTFIFITDEFIRTQCQHDLHELETCLSKQLWKAAIVLSGSLIETVLFETIRYNPVAVAQLGKIEQRKDVKLFTLLRWGQDHGMIDKGIFELADQIRDYRNLIHPNVSVRRKTLVNENIARIAYNVLLEIIRQLTEHSPKQDESVITAVIKEKRGSDPTPADMQVYIPIIHKYGIIRGAEIVRRSLVLVCKNEKHK